MTPTERVLRAYMTCTAEEKARGMVEYARYREVVLRFARQYRVSDRLAAAVLATLSPGLDWVMNQRSAHRAFNDYPIGLGYGQNTRRALAMIDEFEFQVFLRGDRQVAIAHFNAAAFVTGPKVAAFYRLILSGGNPTDICVDGHAFNLAWGSGRRTLKKSTEKIGNARKYTLAREAYRTAARIIGIWPCQLQAATWLAWRSSSGFVQHRIDFPVNTKEVA